MRQAIGSIILAVGALSLIGAVLFYMNTTAFVDRSRQAPGTIVRLVEESDSDGGRLFRPLVRFAPGVGEEIEFQSGVRSNPSPYTAGDAVTVLYDPADPKKAEIQGFFSLWFLPVLFAGVGSLFLAVGVAVLARRPRALFGQPAGALQPSEA
jgi:hypothetical protein